MKTTAQTQLTATHALRILPLLLLILCTLPTSMDAQIILSEDFETDGEGSRYTSFGSFTDGADDYFIRTDGTAGATGIPTYSGFGGSWFWAGEDTDATENTTGLARIEFAPFAINGFQALEFSLSIGAGANNTYDNLDDFLHLQFQIDGGPWTTVLAFENNGAGTNQPLFQDLDLDGIGEGLLLGNTFQSFSSAPVAINGSAAAVRIDAWFDAGGETIAFDDIRVHAVAVPEPAQTAALIALTAILMLQLRRISPRRGKTTNRA